MTNKEKILKGLECCSTNDRTADNCKNCPYWNENLLSLCWNDMYTDIIYFLKKQDAKPVTRRYDYDYRCRGALCPECFEWIPDTNSFCGNCGQEVKWNDETKES